jgi:hypothetical protein
VTVHESERECKGVTECEGKSVCDCKSEHDCKGVTEYGCVCKFVYI